MNDQLDLKPGETLEAQVEKQIIVQDKALPPVVQMEKSGNDIMDLVRYAAANNQLDMVDKFLDIRDREEKRLAENAFNAAYSKMQSELPIIEKRGRGHNNIQYARIEDIIQAVMPVLARHGLSLRHKGSNDGEGGLVIVTAVLAHVDGFSETCTFQSSPDGSGSKNSIQAIKSANTYLRRLTAENILGLASAGEDDDAFSAETTEGMIKYFDAISEAKNLDDLAEINNEMKRDMNMTGKERRSVEGTWKVKWTAMNKGLKNASS